ncbi:hypothetical protein DER46DRAFT_574942 [Fusarium sp. MPI-SDFR-AT-0072]|nr:hypothetical protein DER46DRAFT_574942 [Fusarium sp. MPI-SDFR-AT-0072]
MTWICFARLLCQSRAEVFWRTMMIDAGINHPAEEHYGEELFKDMEAVLFFKMNDFISAETLRSMEVEELKARTDDVMKDFTNLQILKGALPYGTNDTQNPKHFAEARAVILSCKEKGESGRISLPTGMILMVD